MLVRLLREYLRPYRGEISSVVGLQLLSTLATLYLPTLNAQIIDDGVVKGDTSYIFHHGALMLGVSLVQILCASGAVYFGGTLYWVVGVMSTYGGLPLVVGVLIGVLMVAYVSIYPAMVALLVARAVRAFGVSGVWLAPFFWVAAEWIRSSIGGGFPWVLLGSSQARVTPIVQFASIAGVFGLSWLLALVSAAAAATADSSPTAPTSSVVAPGAVRWRNARSITMRPYGSPPGMPNSSS